MNQRHVFVKYIMLMLSTMFIMTSCGMANGGDNSEVVSNSNLIVSNEISESSFYLKNEAELKKSHVPFEIVDNIKEPVIIRGGMEHGIVLMCSTQV